MVRGGLRPRYQITSTRQVDLDESLAAADSLASLEDTGHVAERVWQVQLPLFDLQHCISDPSQLKFLLLPCASEKP